VESTGERIKRLTSQLVVVTRTAGLFSTLQLPDFPSSGLEHDARLHINYSERRRSAGSTSPHLQDLPGNVEAQDLPQKSNDYSRRYRSAITRSNQRRPISSENRHNLLHRDSNVEVDWLAIYILPKVTEDVLLVFEQALTCLLQTYSSGVASTNTYIGG
jgi:hypothetical protein